MRLRTEDEAVTRRAFLGYVIGAIGAFIGTVTAIPLIGFTLSPALKKREAAWVQAGRVGDFQVGQPRLVEFTIFTKDGWLEKAEKKSVWVLRRGEGEFTVYNPRCTHLGCLINWQPETKTFISPCHGGVFSLGGQVMAGPPPRPLDTLAHRVEGEKLLVEYQEFRLGVTEKAPL